MTNAPFEAGKTDDGFARIAFGLLATGLGVAATRSILHFGRERIQHGQRGAFYEAPDASLNLVVGESGVDFTVSPIGTHSLPHNEADRILNDLVSSEPVIAPEPSIE